MGNATITINSQKRLYALPGVEVDNLTLSGGSSAPAFFVTRVPRPLHVSFTQVTHSGASAIIGWSGGSTVASQSSAGSNEVARRMIFVTWPNMGSTGVYTVTAIVVGLVT
jgi:hypothetical protein